MVQGTQLRLQPADAILRARIPLGVRTKTIARQSALAALLLKLGYSGRSAGHLTFQLGNPLCVAFDLPAQRRYSLALGGRQHNWLLWATRELLALTLDFVPATAKLKTICESQTLLNDRQVPPHHGELFIACHTLGRELADFLPCGLRVLECSRRFVQLAADSSALTTPERGIPAAVQTKARTEERLQKLVGRRHAAAVGRALLDRGPEGANKTIRVNDRLDRHLKEAASLAVIIELKSQQPLTEQDILPLTTDFGGEVVPSVVVVHRDGVIAEVPSDP
jgi:hypothetical protein